VTLPVPQSFFAEKDSVIKSANEACANRLTTFLGQSKDVAYFIGSGLSRPDYPSWQELILRMREYFGGYYGSVPTNIPTNENDVAELSPRELQDVFQAFRDYEPNRYVECIKSFFHDR